MSKEISIDPSRELADVVTQVNIEFGNTPIRISICDEHGGARLVWSATTDDERLKWIEAALKRSDCGQIIISSLAQKSVT